MKFSKTTIAIIGVIISALLGALMGVFSRQLATHFELFQQIGLRATTGALIGLLFYSSRINFSNIKKIGRKDLFLILIRSWSVLIGIGLFTYAINNGNFANVNFIYSLPTTAILGFILLKEKVTWQKILIIVLGFFGVALISVKDFSNLGNFSVPEIAAFVSTFFYSFAYITRKWFSPLLNNQELTILGSFNSGITALTISLLIGNGLFAYPTTSLDLFIIIIAAGISFIVMGYFNNYGFEHLTAVAFNNLMATTAVFGLLISVLYYKEIPTVINFVGGILVVISAILINYADKKTLK